MKYCEKCGKEIADNVMICPGCGNDIQQKYLMQQTIIQPPKINGMAIAGFICAFFFPLLGFIFGIVGAGKSKKLKNGLGLSIAAIIISIVGLIFLYFLLWGSMTLFNYIKDLIYNLDNL